jgi:peptidoglycan/LPS O-acetylase OafA/YrhL
MLTVILINYIAAGLIGVYLFTKLFSPNPSKLIVGIIHGAMGLAGLGMFVFYISFQKGESPVIPFLLILVAFFFGAGMLATKLSGKKFPKVIAVIHIAIAVTGIVMLIQFYLSN